MSTMTLTEVRDRLRDECAMVEGDATKYPECAYHVSASVLEDLVEALNHHLAQPAQAVDVGAEDRFEQYVATLIEKNPNVQRLGEQLAHWLNDDQFNNVEPILLGIARALSGENAGSVDGWQPIATAPQTNRAILVWCPERKNTYAVTWDRGEWRAFGGGTYLTEQPTHWMPLPASPTPDKEG